MNISFPQDTFVLSRASRKFRADGFVSQLHDLLAVQPWQVAYPEESVKWG